MQKYIFVGLGGFIGAILRHLIKSNTFENYSKFFPFNTLIINITGCFLLGFILTLTFKALPIWQDLRLGIATGLLGAYTTFSTLCKESFKLISNSQYTNVILYLLCSSLLGIFAVFSGVLLAREISKKAVKMEVK